MIDNDIVNGYYADMNILEYAKMLMCSGGTL